MSLRQLTRRSVPFLVLALTGLGCGGSEYPPVTGRVTIGGKDASGVLVILTTTDGTTYKGTTLPDGTFTIGGVPDGEMAVTFDTAPDPGAYMVQEIEKHKAAAGGSDPTGANRASAAPPRKKAGKGTPVPARYKDATSSEQTWTVDENNRTKNFDLTK